MRTATSRRVLRFLTFALAFGVSGCGGNMHWHKPDGSDSAMARDLEVCRNEAQARYGSPGALGIGVTNDPRFGPIGPSQADQRMQESQAASNCMRGKGYVLVPDTK